MLVLASQSPRRAELLAQLQREFITLPANIDESVLAQESAAEYVERLAIAKARAVQKTYQHPAAFLGSDTAVVVDGEILGKPTDFEDVHRMLTLLSGRWHQVMTAVALIEGDRCYSVNVITDVQFRTLTEQEIKAYWATSEPSDKAGGYGIQGLGGQFVRQIRGSYSAVVGLPLCETHELLLKIGMSANWENAS